MGAATKRKLAELHTTVAGIMHDADRRASSSLSPA